ncbi:MAG: class I SAM-dependent methyltransferase [Candidatus Neomarinimicrobiota bacterium]|jgi:SAM-dependent methyltransferase
MNKKVNESAFAQFANAYDEWFLKNENVLRSEVRLLAYFLQEPGKTLSIGCGSGLFEAILKRDYGIIIEDGVEPAEGMAKIASQRGMNVRIGTAETIELGNEKYDAVIFNGCPSYINDLQEAFDNAFEALKPGGKILVLDIPKESSYALLYNLAKEIGSWEHQYFEGAIPPNVYPIAFVQDPIWFTTPEKVDLLKKSGFSNFEYAQTLTKHPAYSNQKAEEPVEGYDRGDYVAIKAVKE